VNPVLRLASNGGKVLRLLLLFGALLLQLLQVLQMLLLLLLLQPQLLLLPLLLLGQSSHCGFVIINIPPVCDRKLPLVVLQSAYVAGMHIYIHICRSMLYFPLVYTNLRASRATL